MSPRFFLDTIEIIVALLGTKVLPLWSHCFLSHLKILSVHCIIVIHVLQFMSFRAVRALKTTPERLIRSLALACEFKSENSVFRSVGRV